MRSKQKRLKNHLKLVFLYEIDPSYSDNKIVQQIFQNIHDGKDPIDGITVTQKPDAPFGEVIIKC